MTIGRQTTSKSPLQNTRRGLSHGKLPTSYNCRTRSRLLSQAQDKFLSHEERQAIHNRGRKVNQHRAIKNKQIEIANHKANDNLKTNNMQITTTEQKAKNNHKTNKTIIANRNETMTGTRISENTVSRGEYF